MKKYRYDITCQECGRFCKPADSGTHYGGPTDLEPPDEVYWCKDCANRKMEQAQEQPETIIDCYWIKPRFVAHARKLLMDTGRFYSEERHHH